MTMVPKEYLKAFGVLGQIAEAAERQAQAAERQADALEKLEFQSQQITTQLGNITGILEQSYEQGWG